MKKNNICQFLLSAFFTLAIISLSACEKVVIDYDEEQASEISKGNVVLRFIPYEIGDFTRATTDISDICSRVNLAVFDGETKLKTISQQKSDAGFGTVTLTLNAGSYELVVIAHSCDGSATITSPDKVTFPNNKVTDTFYYYGSLEVGSDTEVHELVLTRCVAMFRLVLSDDEIPANVDKFKFYYLGGSSTFSPKQGYGNVQSKQTEIRTVNEGGIYDVFTFPHTEQDVLTKLEITALDVNDNTIKQHIFENVPVTRNRVTRYTGKFFGGSGSVESGGFKLKADPNWAGTDGYKF